MNRTADGSAGWFARWYALAHSARCSGCKEFLDALTQMVEAMRRARTGPSPDAVSRLTAIIRENAP